jgi:hypothetical protein
VDQFFEGMKYQALQPVRIEGWVPKSDDSWDFVAVDVPEGGVMTCAGLLATGEEGPFAIVTFAVPVVDPNAPPINPIAVMLGQQSPPPMLVGVLNVGHRLTGIPPAGYVEFVP